MPCIFQVVDGFFVKKVQDIKESAAYLTVMTRHLQKLYQVYQAVMFCFIIMLFFVCLCNTPFYLFSQNRTLFNHSRELQGDDVRNGEIPHCSLISFSEFNYGAVKNKVA